MSALLCFVRAGMPFAAVADLFGVDATSVGRIARAHGYSARSRISIGRRDRTSRLVERAYAKTFGCPMDKGARPLARPVAVPLWAKRAGLAEDYRDHALAFGEFAAARHCRALKRAASEGVR